MGGGFFFREMPLLTASSAGRSVNVTEVAPPLCSTGTGFCGDLDPNSLAMGAEKRADGRRPVFIADEFEAMEALEA